MIMRGVPVLVEFLEHDAVLRHALDEFIGAGADRVLVELVARRLGGLGRNHDAGAVGELRDERREWGLEQEADGQGIDDLDAGNGADLALAPAARQGERALDRVLHRGGVELRAVMEGDARPQREGDRAAVLGGRPLGRQLRHDAAVGRELDELVAERGKNMPADEGPVPRRIERIGVVLQGDADVLSAGAAG